MRHDLKRTIGRARSLTGHATPRRTAIAALVAAALVAALPTTAAAQPEPLRVCTTVPDLGALAREVGGDQVSVTVFVRGTEDPHYAEAKPSHVRALNQADLFIQIGLEMETGYAPLLLQQARNPRVLPGTPGFLDASTAAGGKLDVPTGVVDRSMGDLHPGGNPHYLLDPLRGVAVAGAIASRLGELRPAEKAAFDARFAAFQSQIHAALVGDALAAKYGADVAKLALLYQHGKLTSFLEEQGERGRLGGWLGALLPYVGTKAVDDHPIWAYFADRFGLRIVGHLEPLPGVPPTTKHLEQIIEQMRAQEVKIVLASAYYDPRYARLVGEKTGARVLAMANQVDAVPAANTYSAMIAYNVQQVVSALGGR